MSLHVPEPIADAYTLRCLTAGRYCLIAAPALDAPISLASFSTASTAQPPADDLGVFNFMMHEVLPDQFVTLDLRSIDPMQTHDRALLGRVSLMLERGRLSWRSDLPELEGHRLKPGT